MQPGSSDRYHDPSLPRTSQRPTYLPTFRDASPPSFHTTTIGQPAGLGIHYPAGNRLVDILDGREAEEARKNTTSYSPATAHAEARPSFHGSDVLLNDSNHLRGQGGPSGSYPIYSYQKSAPLYREPFERQQQVAESTVGQGDDRTHKQSEKSRHRAYGDSSALVPIPYHHPPTSAGGHSRGSALPPSPRSQVGSHQSYDNIPPAQPLRYPIQDSLQRNPSYASPHILPPTASSSYFSSLPYQLQNDRRLSDQPSFGRPSPSLGSGGDQIPHGYPRRDSQLATLSARPSLGAESTHSLRSSSHVYQLPPLPVNPASLQAWRNDLINHQALAPSSSTNAGLRTVVGGHSRNISGDSARSANGGYSIPALPVSSNSYGLAAQVQSHNHLTRSRISSLASVHQDHPHYPITNYQYPSGTPLSTSSTYLPSPLHSPYDHSNSAFPGSYDHHDNEMPPRRATNASASASVRVGTSANGAPGPYMPPAGPTTRSRLARGIAAGSLYPSYPDSTRGSVISVASSVQNQNRGGSGMSQSSRAPNCEYGTASVNGNYAEPGLSASSSGSMIGSRVTVGRGPNAGTIYRPVGQQRSAYKSSQVAVQEPHASRGYRSTDQTVAGSGGRQHTVYELLEPESDDGHGQPGPSSTRAGQKRKAGDGGATVDKKRRLDSGAETYGQYDQDRNGYAGNRRAGAGSQRGNGTAGTSGSTATQSTLATTVGIAATENAIANHNGYNRAGRNDYAAAVHGGVQINGNGNVPVPVGRTQANVLVGPEGGHGVDGQDDKEGHYVVTAGSHFGPGNRYLIMRLLGQGTFGKVIEAREAYTSRKVAVKIIRAVQKYREASSIEIKVLQHLKKYDPENRNKCIHLLETFDFRNHVCLVSELLGQSVYDFLKENSFMPFPEKHIQDFAKSLLKSLSYVHSLKLVHTDLKPENILLVENKYTDIGARRISKNHRHILRNTDIRLIDFGSATFEGEFKSAVVCTRHYRAPEIIVGLGWSYPCDLFSIGCILVEFYTGDALFQTHDNLEHLAMMEVVMGKMPVAVANRAVATEAQYFRGKKLDWPNSQTSKKSQRYVKEMRSLNQTIKPDSPLRQAFFDLCKKLLAFDQGRRLTVGQASQHPYLTEIAPDPPTSADVDANGGSVWGHLRGCPPTNKGRS